ncbi:MAG TPA: 5-bromo-4-chloroindolyl phosphate hydrolysis family protein [Spirochaetia bacterium]|nr:5-bromo-4-chloroindolyl phosphate hydrolysis family protein [Spirochaetia bacterium]
MAKGTVTVGGSIASGVVGGAAFLLFWLVFGLPIFVSLGIGVVAYGAGLLAFRRSPRSVTVEVPGVSREVREAALREGQEKVAELRELSRRIEAPPVRNKFDEVVASAERILDDLTKNPKDIRAARQFLSYYLDATVKIATRYVELSAKNLDANSIQDSLRRVESMLDLIRGAFEKQHARLLEGDVMDLDAEMTLLKQTLTMEGLGPEEKKT